VGKKYEHTNLKQSNQENLCSQMPSGETKVECCRGSESPHLAKAPVKGAALLKAGLPFPLRRAAQAKVGFPATSLKGLAACQRRAGITEKH